MWLYVHRVQAFDHRRTQNPRDRAAMAQVTAPDT
jgi:hypothetical protein